MSNFVKVEEGSAFVLVSTLESSSDCKAARLYMHWPDFMLSTLALTCTPCAMGMDFVSDMLSSLCYYVLFKPRHLLAVTPEFPNLVIIWVLLYYSQQYHFKVFLGIR